MLTELFFCKPKELNIDSDYKRNRCNIDALPHFSVASDHPDCSSKKINEREKFLIFLYINDRV